MAVIVCTKFVPRYPFLAILLSENILTSIVFFRKENVEFDYSNFRSHYDEEKSD